MAGTSSYLIDSSKKCAILGNMPGLRQAGTSIPWSVFGDVDTKCLQKMGFQFSENFGDGTGYVVESLNKLTKPIGTAINAVTKQIPMLKNVNFENPADTLRTSAIFLKVLLDTFTKDGIQDTAESIQALDTDYKYRIPMRKGAPSITPTMSSGITINFAYGKCNKFNAKEEVWDPLMNLKEVLFPKAIDSGDGLIRFSNQAKVPIPQMIEVETVKSLLTDSVNLVSTVSADTAGSIFNSIKTLKDVSTSLETLDTESKLKEMEDSSVALGATSTEKKEGFWGWLGVGAVTKTGRQFATDMQNAAKEVALEPGKLTNLKNYNSVSEFPDSATVDLNSVAEDVIEAAEAQATKKVAEDPNIKVIPPKKAFDVKKAVTDPKWATGSDKRHYRSETNTGDSSSSLDEILKSLAMIEPTIVGKISNRIGEALDDMTLRIEIGYAPIYFTALDDMAKALATTIADKKDTNKIQSAITLQHFLIKKASIVFDIDHLDEFGYPMAGQLNIEELWNLEFPSNTFSLNAGNSENPTLLESMIEPDADI